MSASVNKVILVGNVQPRDAELRFTSGGTPVAKFSLATSEKFGKGPDRQEKTEWHNIVVWGKLAEFCGEYIKKGRQIYLEGRIETSKWEKDGKKNYKTEIIAGLIQLLDRRDDAGRGYRDAPEQDAARDKMIDDTQGGSGHDAGGFGGADQGAGPSGHSDLGPDDGELPF